MEKILKIEEGTFRRGDWDSYDGYIVTTDKQTIQIGISNGQSCCERWGYATSNDNFVDFVGAVLYDVRVVDAELDVTEKVSDYEGNIMFVNLETSNGTLQFVMYNEHNGYYGHEAVVYSSQCNETEVL